MKRCIPVLTLVLLAAGMSPLAAQDDEDAARAEMERLEESLKQAREAMTDAAREMAKARAELRRAKPGGPGEHARIGVILEATEDGPRIQGVTPGGPADQAGLERGDVIVELNGETVDNDPETSVQKLADRVRKLTPGEPVTLKLLRDGGAVTVEVTPESDPFVWAFHMPRAPRPPDAPMPDVVRELEKEFRHTPLPEIPEMHFFEFSGLHTGLELATVNPRLGEYFGTDRGLLVLDVGPSDDDDRGLGLEPGDVILSLDGRDVKATTDFHRELRGHDPGTQVAIEIMRDGERQTVTAEVPERRHPFVGYQFETVKKKRTGPSI